MLLLRNEDRNVHWEEQEADQRGRDPLHDGVLAHGRLCVRDLDRRHPGYREQRQGQCVDLPEAPGRSHRLHEQQQGGQTGSGNGSRHAAHMIQLLLIPGYSKVYL